MSESAVALSRDDLPASYWAASEHSTRGQRVAIRWLAAQLILLSGGAVLGAVDGVNAGGIDLGAASAAAALLVSLVPAAWLAARNPQRAWYEGRAAAESIKTLAWKYAIRAEPFDCGDQAAIIRLKNDLTAIRLDLSTIAWPQHETIATPAMSALRAASLPTRRSVYRMGRIDAERRWYAEKTDNYIRMSRRWSALAVIATVAGLTGGVLKATGVLAYDGLGAASSIAAAATAWLQMKQFRPLAAAYRLTGRELSAVDHQLEHVTDEPDWAQRAASAEDAISREHTMWLARREAV
ncbi:DUF4231 domain-containing protein [Actinoplanes sp. NBRC 103695]|uniref:DUF4231 domain-containing protein n=1 Tax=Actinoplanes sp. NBRC 103695 TaxID=3032202 RepID=UPI002554D946|nr:DUF4231 domain-containing protein [Actinoplanes sp. NBRC 103695]